MLKSSSVQDFIRAASHTACHFGFLPLEKIKKSPQCLNSDKKVKHTASAMDRRRDALYGILTSGMCTYFDYKLNAIEGPVLFYTTGQVPRTGDIAVTFQVLNVKKSIAETLLIQTVSSLLNDLGLTKHMVRINSLGDTDSTARYIRDLTNYLRKHMVEMPVPARELMKEHPLVALLHLIENNHDLVHRSPNPLEYLTDSSRKHFREIVEFLDMSNTPFEIDSRLLGHHECYSDALFAFDILDENNNASENPPLVIRGGRYSTFIQKMSRLPIPGAGAVIILKDKKAPDHIPVPRIKYNPNVYLVQLGFGPKVKSLMLIDKLRSAGISVYQNIMSDSLSEQLQHAQSKGVRYVIILGHKEYMENCVILRDLEQQNQESVSADMLPSLLRKVAVPAS